MSQPRVRIPYLPPRIEGLAALATNLWWSWSTDARAVFRRIDEPLWHLTKHNPLELLHRVDPARLASCAADPGFLALYDRVMDAARRALTSPNTWFSRQYPDLTQPVAYFCAEFGLHNSVPIYSGGLGVLAGDHLKAASDLGVPLVGVGLFYTKGYFDQQLRIDGWQEDSDERFDVDSTPLERLPGPRRRTVPDGGPTTFGRPVHVARLADAGRPGAGVPARHQPRAERRRRTATSRTSSTPAGPTCGSGRSGSSASAACGCCAPWGSSPRPGTPTKGMPRSCWSSGCASWSRAACPSPTP